MVASFKMVMGLLRLFAVVSAGHAGRRWSRSLLRSESEDNLRASELWKSDRWKEGFMPSEDSTSFKPLGSSGSDPKRLQPGIGDDARSGDKDESEAPARTQNDRQASQDSGDPSADNGSEEFGAASSESDPSRIMQKKAAKEATEPGQEKLDEIQDSINQKTKELEENKKKLDEYRSDAGKSAESYKESGKEKLGELQSGASKSASDFKNKAMASIGKFFGSSLMDDSDQDSDDGETESRLSKRSRLHLSRLQHMDSDDEGSSGTNRMASRKGPEQSAEADDEYPGRDSDVGPKTRKPKNGNRAPSAED